LTTNDKSGEGNVWRKFFFSSARAKFEQSSKFINDVALKQKQKILVLLRLRIASSELLLSPDECWLRCWGIQSANRQFVITMSRW